MVYGDNNIFLSTLFLNSCSHGLQKLNYYDHVFFKLANIWIGPKICGNLKNKVQILESRWNVFANIWFFFLKVHLNIDVVNILIYIFWLIKFVFITKIIPNPLKNGIIVGDTFGVLLQVQMILHKLLWKARG
jgi:hypothetical protein